MIALLKCLASEFLSILYYAKWQFQIIIVSVNHFREFLRSAALLMIPLKLS